MDEIQSREWEQFLNTDSPLIHKPDGTRQNHSSMRRIHNHVCGLANVREIRIHDLRHTFASHWTLRLVSNEK